MLKQGLGLRKQKGFTLVGWIVVLAIFLFFAYLAMILTPYIVSNHTMNNILESLKQEPGITQKSKRDIWRLIENRMTINQVRSVTRDDFEIVKTKDRVDVYLDYEDRVHFSGDIYIVFVREKHVELVRN
jgi:competence protein ComGC